jgi:hypothetical protein
MPDIRQIPEMAVSLAGKAELPAWFVFWDNFAGNKVSNICRW